MRYFPRVITNHGTVRMFCNEWHGERFGSLIGSGNNGKGLKPGDLVFVAIEFWGAVPLLLHTNNPPHDYGNTICRLERVA